MQQDRHAITLLRTFVTCCCLGWLLCSCQAQGSAVRSSQAFFRVRWPGTVRAKETAPPKADTVYTVYVETPVADSTTWLAARRGEACYRIVQTEPPTATALVGETSNGAVVKLTAAAGHRWVKLQVLGKTDCVDKPRGTKAAFWLQGRLRGKPVTVPVTRLVELRPQFSQ